MKPWAAGVERPLFPEETERVDPALPADGEYRCAAGRVGGGGLRQAAGPREQPAGWQPAVAGGGADGRRAPAVAPVRGCGAGDDCDGTDGRDAVRMEEEKVVTILCDESTFPTS